MAEDLHNLVVIGEAVRVAREERGLTQLELAAAAETSRLSIIRIEQGTQVKTGTLAKVVDALGLEIGLHTKE